MKLSIAYPLVFLAAVSVNVPSLIFQDPREDPKRSRRTWIVSEIPLRKGEKFLMHKSAQRANSVVLLMKAPYNAALREIRATVARKIGILAEGTVTQRDDGVFPEEEALPRGVPYRSLTFGKGFTRFRAVGLGVEHGTEYQLKSQRYNQVPEISGSSELRLRMTDGRVMFGRDSQLVEIRRIDYTKQHPRYFDIPLPFTEAWEDDLVTDTEIDMIQDAIARLGSPKVRYFVPYPGYRDEEYWRQLMAEIKEAALAL